MGTTMVNAGIRIGRGGRTFPATPHCLHRKICRKGIRREISFKVDVTGAKKALLAVYA
jgi:hypothetical protein